MGSSPSTVVNRALDAIGRPDLCIGDLQEGSEGAAPALRAYLPALRQLLRAAQWDFSRKFVPLQLLADATGQTTGVGTTVQAPWYYAYALPTDAERVRFVPWNGQPQSPTNPPVSTAFQNPPLNTIRLIPAPYLLSLDVNYPVVVGSPSSWGDIPNWASTAGTGPVQRTVVLSNVKCAWCCYTAFVAYPSQWDSLFEEAMVQVLASRLAMPLAKDARQAMALEAKAVANAKAMITQARAINANESGAPQTTDSNPDWMRVRYAGGGSYGYGFGGLFNGFGQGFAGGFGYGGWDCIGLGSGGGVF